MIDGAPSGKQAGPRAPKPRRRWLRASIIVAAILFIAAITVFLFRKPILIEVARILVVQDTPLQSDYIVIPGGDANSRPFLAAELYKKGIAPKILLFQGKSDKLVEAGFALTEDQVYLRVLISNGVPASAVEILPGVVDSTEDEAASLRKFLYADKANPAARVTIVTSAEHTRRARWVFRKMLRGSSVEVRMVAAWNPWYNDTNWWQDDLGAIAIAHEYLKFPFYLYRYAW